MEDRPVTGRLIRPGRGLPVRARKPAAPLSRVLARATGAALGAPAFALALGGCILLSRTGWGVATLLTLQAVEGDGVVLLAAFGLVLCAALLSGLVELALWAGAVPVLTARMRGARVEAWGPIFARGVELLFAPLLGLGLLRVLVWLLLQLASLGAAVAFLAAILAGPASAPLVLPAFFLLVAGDLLWRVAAWAAMARIGARKEGLLQALLGSVLQVARRPAAHLLALFVVNVALSIGGAVAGGIVAAGLGGGTPVGALLLAVLASLVAGAVLLWAMCAYTALALDAEGALPSGSIG